MKSCCTTSSGQLRLLALIWSVIDFWKHFFCAFALCPSPRADRHTQSLCLSVQAARDANTQSECAVGQQRQSPCSFSRTNLWFHQGYQKTRMIKYKWKETLLVQLSTVSRYKLQISLWGSCAKLKTLLFEATTWSTINDRYRWIQLGWGHVQVITYHRLMRHLIETQVAQESRGRTSIAKAIEPRSSEALRLVNWS